MSGVNGTGAIGGAAAAARYRRFDNPRGSAAGAASERQRERVAAPPASAFDDESPLPTPARLLASLIDRMGGAAGSRVKGSFVNLRV